MPLPQSSKQKSARTWWGYHARPNPRERRLNVLWRWATIAGLLVLAAGLPRFLTTAGGSPLLDHWASPGHVTAAHQAWNHDCEACHQPFRPIKSNREGAELIGRQLAQWVGHQTTANEKCQRCHAASAHHSNLDVAHAGNCADCHEDHRGLGHSLVDLDDSKCLRCHHDLRQHASHPERVDDRIARIREFGTQHPPFRSETEPHRRGLKFSHAVHMLTGMGLKRWNPVAQDVQEGGPFTYAQIDDAYRSAYLQAHEDPASDAPVQLVCSDCHQLDAGRVAGQPASAGPAAALPGESLNPPRGDGRYYLPIVYDKHCRGCHPLGFDAENPAAVVSHGQQPAAVQAEVLEYFSRRYLTEALRDRLRRPENLRLDPLPELLTKEEKEQLAERARAAAEQANADLYALLEWADSGVTQRIDSATVALFQGRKTCGECHFGEGKLTPDGPAPQTIEPVNIPTIWQTKARFDHVAHQGVACGVCHPHTAQDASAGGSDPLGALQSERQRAREYAPDEPAARGIYQHPPDLPTLEQCRTCHSQRGWWPTATVHGGAGQRCTTCHTYHNVEHGLQGRGAATLSPQAGAKSAVDFLRPSRGWDSPASSD